MIYVDRFDNTLTQHQYKKPLQLGIFLLLSFNTVSDFDTNIFTPND